MNERRKSSRGRTLLGARIEFDNRATLDCVIRNLSADGARLVCSQHVALPDQFRILVKKQHERFEAKAVWRGEEELGVQFLRDDAPGNVIAFDPSRRPRR